MTRKTRTARFGLVAALAATAVAVIPAGASAESFGSKLATNIQPSNAGNGHYCDLDDHSSCTRVMMEGYTNGPGVGSPKAPHDGTIDKIKLIAQNPGNFNLQLARAKPNEEKAKVVYTGPQLSYDGDQGGSQSYTIETFNVNVPVDKGDFLAIRSKRTSMLRCSSGGANQLLFQPVLQVNGPFTEASGTDGCWLLLEAVYE
jgi:hypothetical protein